MKILIMATALSVTAAAPPMQMDQPTFEAPARPWSDVADAERQRQCRDRIEQVRAAAGRPELDRSPANPDKPLLIYAVDTRIDNCSVVVPVADPSDIRQIPQSGRAELIPAR